MTHIEAMKLALEALEDLGMKHYENTGEVLYKETFTALRQAIEQAEQAQPVAWIDAVMEQAQVFASAWSLVGGRFDNGSGMEDAEQAKAELRAMLTTPPRQPLTDEQVIRGGEAVSEALQKIGIEISDADLNATEIEQEIAEYVFTQMQEAAHGITKENT